MLSDFDMEGKNKLEKTVYYLKNYGMSYTVKKALRKFGVPISPESEYMTWCRRTEPAKQELKEQKNSPLAKKYAFSVVLERGEEERASDWKKQTCSNVSVVEISRIQDGAELLNKAKGDYLVFSGKDAFPKTEYLYEISRMIEKGGDLIYTDEDNCWKEKRFRPFFKPDASLHFLLNFQYLGRIFVVKKTLFEKAVKETKGELTITGDDWYDIALQSFRFAEKISHVPKVLFSNQVGGEDKNRFVRSTDENQKNAICHYLKTEGIKGAVTLSDVPGFFHVEYDLKREPLVSILIPNKDHVKDLKLCLDSLKNRENYRNYEVIIAENNSEEDETFDYYDKIQKEDERIHVVTYKGDFNYSAINNFAAGYAKGELLLLLNNDTEFMGKGALKEMAASCMQENMAACGAMLYYGDDTIQHAGVIIGMGGFAANALWSLRDRDETYYPFSLCIREVSAATAACLMVRRKVFDEVGGMGEDFKVALNDVDFCMKIRKKGYGILFNPYAKLYHYESKSRGYEDTMEKQARFSREIEHFQEKWEKEIREGDMFYNPNLTLHRADYSMDI